MKDPVFRTASPYPDPNHKGPKSLQQSTRGVLPKSRLSFFPLTCSSSSSPWPSGLSLAPPASFRPYGLPVSLIANPGCLTVISNSVNKTSLHPGGVQPHHEHTQLEEELHETAHIDYDRVAIVRRPSSLSIVLSHPLTSAPPRSLTPPLLLSTKMLSSTRPALPSPPAVLSLPTLAPRLAALPVTSVLSRSPRLRTTSGKSSSHMQSRNANHSANAIPAGGVPSTSP